MPQNRDINSPLSRFQARLARPRSAKRIDALLSTENPSAAIRALNVSELYFLIKEVGLIDAVDLVALASPDQFQGCLDLEAWDSDQLQQQAILPWLAVLMETGFEKVGQVWQGLDPELTALVMARNIRIYDHSLDEEAPEDSELPRFETPDRFFTIELTSDSEDDIRLIAALIGDLYRADLALARHTLMSARSEMPSYLEEMSYRWRSGRLADLGYVDFYQALEVFRPLDPKSVVIGEETAEIVGDGAEQNRGPGNLPVPMLERVLGRSFLARALSAIDDAEEANRLESALIVLVNKVLAAAKVSPGDEEAVLIGTEHATATLALGLETVSRGNDDAAKRALQSISLGRLHRVGYTVSLRLARAATQLLPRARGAGDPTNDVLAALAKARPFYSGMLDVPPTHEIRPFESLRDIATVAAHLRQLTARIALAQALGADLIAATELETTPNLDSHGQTAIANYLINGRVNERFEDLSLTTDDAKKLAEILAGDNPPTSQEIAERFTHLIAGTEITIDQPALAMLAETMLTRMIEEFAPFAQTNSDIDPRFIETIRLTATQS